MVKKTMNSLFLNYLLQSKDNIEANVEKWTKDFNIAENIDEISETLNEHMVFIMACWGEIGWCLPKWKEQEIKLGKVLNDLKNNIPINNIDEGLAECFKEKEIEALVILIQNHFNNSEKIKLDLTFELYLKQEYFASSVLLAGLIDSTSINQYLKTHDSESNVSQCWKCYGKVIQEKYGGKYFSGSFPYNESAKNNQRAKKTIDFFRSIKHEGCFDNEKSILIQLSFALLKFFDDSNWQDKHNGKIPSSINRHWLVHSMYDYDDIKRADCVKLFCILFQMVELYSLEEKRHLRKK